MDNHNLSAEEVARRLKVTACRVRAKANTLNKKGFSVGIRVSGIGIWFFSEDDIKLLAAPIKPSRPRKQTT